MKRNTQKNGTVREKRAIKFVTIFFKVNKSQIKQFLFPVIENTLICVPAKKEFV